jgi:hypothetical protein
MTRHPWPQSRNRRDWDKIESIHPPTRPAVHSPSCHEKRNKGGTKIKTNDMAPYLRREEEGDMPLETTSIDRSIESGWTERTFGRASGAENSSGRPRLYWKQSAHPRNQPRPAIREHFFFDTFEQKVIESAWRSPDEPFLVTMEDWATMEEEDYCGLRSEGGGWWPFFEPLCEGDTIF